LEYNARNRTAEKVLSVITAMNDVFRVKTAEKKKDDSLMTKEEYFAMLDESIRQAERGEVVEYTPELEQKLFGAIL